MDAFQGVRRLCQGRVPQGNDQIVHGCASAMRYNNHPSDGFGMLERMKPSENVLVRVGALYGAYALYTTQPSTRAPRLGSVSSIEVSFGGSCSPRVISSPLI